MTSWRQQTITDVKASIRQELRHIEAESGVEARLKHCLKQASICAEGELPLERLQCLIYCLSALYHQRVHGGLNPAEINRLADLANTVLSVENIRPGSSAFAYFHGELQLMLSQIHYFDGEYFRSTWENELANYLSSPNPVISEPHRILSQGIRLARMGHLTVAKQLFIECPLEQLPGNMQQLLALHQLRVCRMMGDSAQHQKLYELFKHKLSFDEPGQIDFVWEGLLFETMQQKHDPQVHPLIRAVHLDGTHKSPAYVLEAWLWMYALYGQAHPRLPKVNSLRKRFGSEVRRCGYLTTAVRIFEECDDKAIPLPTRITKLGEMLNNAHKLTILDHELLVWKAASKWLTKRKAHSFALITDARYRGLSSLVTDGYSHDALHLESEPIRASA